MKKLILSLFSLFSVFAGVPHCLGNPAPEEVRASQPNRERRHGAYSKDNWTVYYEGRKVKGASASSFTDLGGGYGKDDWTVFYRGRKVEGASASSSHQHSHVWGNVMIMLCACATALYMVWFKALVARYRITTVLRWVYCVAAVVALPFGLKEIIHTDYAAIAGHALFPTLFVLTVPTYLPNLMLNYALKSVPATVSSIYTYLQPVLAIAISVGMGLDKLHADTVVFALVIFVGVGLVLRSYSVPPRHPDPPAAPPH